MRLVELSRDRNQCPVLVLAALGIKVVIMAYKTILMWLLFI